MTRKAGAARRPWLSPPPSLPPPDSAIPNDEFGAAVKLGRAIFTDTGVHAGAYVGNHLRCSNCHLDAGRLANSAPLAQAYVRYPAFRKKTGQVDTFEERLQGCFRYSMNGKPPPLGDKVLTALTAYAFFLAKGAPTGAEMPGRGYPVVPKPPLPRDYARGETVFGAKCAACHGANGAGTERGKRRRDLPRAVGSAVPSTGAPAWNQSATPPASSRPTCPTATAGA